MPRNFTKISQQFPTWRGSKRKHRVPGAQGHAPLHEEHREMTQRGKEPMCKQQKNQFSNSIQLKVKPA